MKLVISAPKRWLRHDHGSIFMMHFIGWFRRRKFQPKLADFVVIPGNRKSMTILCGECTSRARTIMQECLSEMSPIIARSTNRNLIDNLRKMSDEDRRNLKKKDKPPGESR